MSDGAVLAFDTSAAHCAAALLSGDRLIVRSEVMERGQAERLIPLIEELLAETGLVFGDVTRIGVGTGPGNFTGIRIAVSAARGMALGLGTRAIGVSCLDALRHASGAGTAAIAAPKDMAYVQTGDGPPRLLPRIEVSRDAAWLSDPGVLVSAIAQIAARAPLDGPSPAPLYLKSADAAPARDLPPRILDDA